jgi:Tol biopolymer transport system component
VAHTRAFGSEPNGRLEEPSRLAPRKIRQLTSLGADVTAPRWSPDGNRIVFGSDAAGEYNIWVVDVSGGKPLRAQDASPNANLERIEEQTI